MTSLQAVFQLYCLPHLDDGESEVIDGLVDEAEEVLEGKRTKMRHAMQGRGYQFCQPPSSALFSFAFDCGSVIKKESRTYANGHALR